MELENLMKKINLKASSIEMMENSLNEVIKHKSNKELQTLLKKEILKLKFELNKLYELYTKKKRGTEKLFEVVCNDKNKTNNTKEESIYDEKEKIGNPICHKNSVYSIEDKKEISLYEALKKPSVVRMNKLQNGEPTDEDESYEIENPIKFNFKENQLKETKFEHQLHEMQDKIANTEWIKNNDFIVELPKKLNIPCYAVATLSSYNSTSSRTIQVEINDFVDENGCVIQKCDEFMKEYKNNNDGINIVVKYIKVNGELHYKETYHNVTLYRYFASENDYKDSKLRTITLIFRYDFNSYYSNMTDEDEAKDKKE